MFIKNEKSPAPWEDLGTDRRPRRKFLAICCRKEGVDRGGGILIFDFFKKCVVIPFKSREQFSGVGRRTDWEVETKAKVRLQK